MKRLLLIGLLGLLLLPESAFAQKRRSRQAPIKMGLTVGLKGGIASTNTVGGTGKRGAFTRTYNSRIQPVIGGLLNYRFTQQMSLQVEALYASRGTKAVETNTLSTPNTSEDITFSLGYADVPVLFKYNAKIFYIEAGGVASLLTSSSVDYEVTNLDGPIDGVNSLDIGYTIGAGIELPQGAIFGLRYVRGTSALGIGGALVGGEELENSALQITGGYIFGHSGGGRGRRRR
jgi:hypothetical protein